MNARENRARGRPGEGRSLELFSDRFGAPLLSQLRGSDAFVHKRDSVIGGLWLVYPDFA
ncbi:hypothetical protein SBA2_540004 [Acidobacteriia bacterium SbA2]|nr:hypothetical protein SBA2_540004 [Acidobacteriia bacterium SbA2]